MGHTPERGYGRVMLPPPLPSPSPPPSPPLVDCYRLGSHHTWEDFAQAARGIVPVPEIQIYTWMDADLRELTELVKSVVPEARRRDARLSFALVFSDIHGIFRVHQIGDFLGVAIQ